MSQQSFFIYGSESNMLHGIYIYVFANRIDQVCYLWLDDGHNLPFTFDSSTCVCCYHSSFWFTTFLCCLYNSSGPFIPRYKLFRLYHYLRWEIFPVWRAFLAASLDGFISTTQIHYWLPHRSHYTTIASVICWFYIYICMYLQIHLRCLQLLWFYCNPNDVGFLVSSTADWFSCVNSTFHEYLFFFEI